MSSLSTAQWNRKLAPFMNGSPRDSLLQLATTLALYLVLLASALAAFTVHPFLSVVLGGVSGLFLVRVFVLQHDCGHRSFLPSARTCDMVGSVLSLFTLVPYGYWKRDHDKHHATSGDLDRRGHGDIDTLTVEEYRALGPLGRARYRVYRHPLVLFGLGPVLLFLVRYRLPLTAPGPNRRRDARSVLVTNAALTAWLALLCLVFGGKAVAAAWLPSVAVAASLGVWLFFVQHQIEDAYWRRSSEWSFADAALKGCSLYRLPAWLDWCTGWISHHHVHHLAARIPNYRLRDAARIVQEEGVVPPVIGIRHSLSLARLALWCEIRGRMIPFREMRHA